MNRRQMKIAPALSVLGLALLFAPSAARSAAETSGKLSGYVYDPTGAALSEVPLSLSGPSLMKTLTTQTGDDGRYEFPNVPVGEDYALEVNVPGFTAYRQTGIRVRLGVTTPDDVALTVMAADTGGVTSYQIVEKVNPVLNPDTAAAVVVIDAEKAAATPIFQQVERMAQQVAGVGPGNSPSTRGGLSRYGKFYIDGQDTSDITDGTITAPMNFNAVQNFEIIAGAMDAQYNSLGAITSLVTKSGGNSLTFDVSATLEPASLAAKNSVAAGQQDIFGLYTNNNTAGPATAFYNAVATLGGPIVKDSLWFFASFQQNWSDKDNAINLNGIQYNRPNPTRTTLGRLKLTWQPSSADRISVAANVDHNSIQSSIGTASVTDLADTQVDRGGYWFLANWDHTFPGNALFQLSSGMTYKNVDSLPMNPDLTAISHRDQATGVTDISSGALNSPYGDGNYAHEHKYRWQADPTISWQAKGHQFKAGLQFSFLRDIVNTGTTGNERFSDRGGFCDPNNLATTGAFCRSEITYSGNRADGSLTTAANVFTTGVFLQDRWTVTRQLTLIPGFRVDYGKLYGSDGSLITNLTGFGPRFSATYDVLGDRHVLVVGHAGRSNDVGSAYVAQHANPALTELISTYQTTAPTGFPNCAQNPSQTGCTTVGGASGNRFAPGQTPPHTDELSFGLHSEVSPETVIGVDYTYRYYGNLWSDEEVNRVWDPTGTRIISYKDGIAHTINVTQAADGAYRRYNGVDLWVQGTPGRWDLLASYTLAFTRGTVDDYFSNGGGGYLQNPRFTPFFNGYVSDDQRHTLKGSIAYKLPFGLDIGLRFQYRTGKPLWEGFTNPGDPNGTVYRSPRGTGFPVNTATGQPNFNDPNSWAELRNPDQFILDVQARYNLGQALHIQQKLEVVALLVNALNETNPAAFSSFYSTTTPYKFGASTFAASPLQGELIVRFRN